MFHLSFRDLGIKCVLEPKMPDRSYKDERKLPQRVCFSPSIEQCLLGVHGIDNIDGYDAIVGNKKSFEYVIYESKRILEECFSDYQTDKSITPTASNKIIFPDDVVDILNGDVSNYPLAYIEHFERKRKKMVGLYEEYVFSDGYHKDRNIDFFANITSSSNYFNIPVYVPTEIVNLERSPTTLCDFDVTEEHWSLFPIVVSRIGYLNISTLYHGVIEITDKNVS